MFTDTTVVQIPFTTEMAKAAVEGRKICTARTKSYGKPGDYFYVGATLFCLEAVFKVPLWMVADFLYKAEGFESSAGFVDTWCKIHPRKGFVADQEVFVHFFQKCD
jgi:hypothetical protein